MSKKVLMALAVVAMLGSATMAQTTFSLKVGAGFPNGDFGDSKMKNDDWALIDKSTKGGAGTGFNLGLEWRFDIASVKGLGVALSVDGFYNGLNDDVKDYFDDAVDDAEDKYDEFSLSRPSYINVPAMVGINYQYPLNGNITLFATAALGANLRYITPMKSSNEHTYTDEDGDKTTSENAYEYAFDAAMTFGFRLAAGVTLQNKYSFELGYYNLGAGKVKGTYIYEHTYGKETDSDDETFKLKTVTPSILALRVGISL